MDELTDGYKMEEKLALYGGNPIRSEKIFYGKHHVTQKDIEAVCNVLKSNYLTQGPAIVEFEKDLASFTNAAYAVAVANGTAALHVACIAAGVGPGDEVITSPLTFAASANCVLYCGGTVVFADVKEDTYEIDPASVEQLITKKTKAVIAVDYAGNTADIFELKRICTKHQITLIEDAAHSIGSVLNKHNVGSIADITTFSFHPVKTITGGEGGAITTNSQEFARKARLGACHGITKKSEEYVHSNVGKWYHEQQMLGFNYRLTDFQAALITSQLHRISELKERRNTIVSKYRTEFQNLPGIILQSQTKECDPCWHLFTIRIEKDVVGCDRSLFFAALEAENIQPQVHYIPVYHHPYYRAMGYRERLCPVAEKIYESILTIPLYPAMSDQDVDDVISAVKKIYFNFRK